MSGSDESAFQPTTSDGFETGDYRNFAPVYLGTESEWIRPTATVIDEDPIAGEYSLQWSASEDPHRWVLTSNAFSLSRSVEVSVSLRVDGPPDEPFAGGIGFAETQTRATAVRITETGLELAIDSWDAQPVATETADVDRGETCELTLRLENGSVTATLDDSTGQERARLRGETTIEPNALGLYVNTAADGETTLTFDDVRVESAPYRVRADEWTRSPQFVVLPRAPDVGEDQGNWVGAQTVIDEGDRYRMWYRIRTNEGRGVGFGLAESDDGVDWSKHDDNPVLVPDHGQDSMEGITTLHVDGTYRAWYTMNRDETWHVVHATSDDGVTWTDRGIVIEGFCKDPSVIYVDGTYYLYAIAPNGTAISVYTSEDGYDWTMGNTIDQGSHAHPGACYVEETGTFWLYAFAEERSASPPSRVRRASSDDGVDFSSFEATWHDMPVGLDYRPTGGIDYGAFPGDGHGHLAHDDRVTMYYQARHDYLNNRPNWHMAGDGKVVLAGRFSGLFEGVPTTVDEFGYQYHGFPMHASPVSGFDVTTSDSATVVVDQWSPDRQPVTTGSIETTDRTTLTVRLSGLDADREFVFSLDETESLFETDADGTATFEETLPADTDAGFELQPR